MPQILSNLIFPSYLLAYPEIAMCLAYTSKKFKFWRLCLRGTPHRDTPNLVKFYVLPILKISSLQCKWLKFEFWYPCLSGSLHFGTPKFCQILSFCHIFLS